MGRDQIASITLSMLLALPVMAGSRDQAKRIHDRLTGVPASDEMLTSMQWAIDNLDAETAAYYAIDGAPSVGGNPSVDATGTFYSVTVKNWVSPWTNESQDVFAPLNDYSATVIGMIRDEADFREILSGDVIYRGNVPDIPPYRGDDNDHYEFLEASGANLSDTNVLVEDSQSSLTDLPAEAVAGVMTTRASARAFFVDGTNRAMLRFTLLNHLCMDMEQLKDDNAPSDRIRQDVSRSPGGDSSLFLNQCIGCHAGMDPLAQAFAYYEFPYPSEEEAPGLELDQRKDQGSIVYTSGAVQPKYLINSATFSTGYVTENDHWTNYWRLGDNSGRVGWRNAAGNSGSVDMAREPAYAEGDGAASLGQELANTEAFAQCQVKKAFKTICLREPIPGGGDEQAVADFVDDFHANHNMKTTFAQIAGYCASDL